MLLLGGPVPVAPYATFGTPELAEAVLDALEGRSAALMANHGAIAHGPDLDAALERSFLLEWACTVYWRAAAIGAPRSLDEEQRTAVVSAALARGYGSTRPAGDGR
jgi:L-fuculose-phosphate aldolase